MVTDLRGVVRPGGYRHAKQHPEPALLYCTVLYCTDAGPNRQVDASAPIYLRPVRLAPRISLSIGCRGQADERNVIDSWPA
jgi:hypothetical protein